MNGFTAGDIKIEDNSNTSIKTAVAVWKDAKRNIADLLEDEEFVFKQV